MKYLLAMGKRHPDINKCVVEIGIQMHIYVGVGKANSNDVPFDLCEWNAETQRLEEGHLVLLRRMHHATAIAIIPQALLKRDSTLGQWREI